MANTLSGLMSPLADVANSTGSDLPFQSDNVLNNEINPKGSGPVSQLINNNGAALDFSGLGAQAFQEALNVHLDLTQHITTAFNGASKALTSFGDAVNSLSSHYDGQLSSIKTTNYAPGTSLTGSASPVAEAARSAFLALNPQTAMIDDIIGAADGNAILQDGSFPLLSALSSAYNKLIGQAEGASISFPPPEVSNPTNQAQARQMVISSLDALYGDVSKVYSSWGSAIDQAFSSFKSSMNAVQQAVQPFVDILNNKLTSAAAIMAMIHMISGSNEPISIVQTGPNSIMVYISGTNVAGYGEDTNIWNALGTGMGMQMPYEQDVIAAIEQFSAEHGLVNPQVTLAGHSLGGMVAQQIAEQHLFNVNQVITFGSPIMGPPVRGVKYDLYEADSDIVPLLSRYENPTLPGSLQGVAALFPAPGKETGWKHILLNAAGALPGGGGIVAGVNLLENGRGAATVLNEYRKMSAYLPPTDPHLFSSYLGPQAKLQFMDPHGNYKGELQRVPDLSPSLGFGVHSDYEQSPRLESQQVVSPMKLPSGGFLSNVQYFGMPNEYKTAQINQYMKSHSTLGEGYSLYSQLTGGSAQPAHTNQPAPPPAYPNPPNHGGVASRL